MSDPRVEAIRACPIVGKGSCSFFNEATGDQMLIAMLNDNGCATVEVSLKWARDDEEMMLECALDQRFGEDSDPQLIAWNKWKAKRKEVEDREQAKHNT